MIIYPQIWGTATTDRIFTLDNTTIQNFDPLSIVMIVRPTTLTNIRELWHKNTVSANLKILRLSGTTGNLEMNIGRATTNTSYITSNTPLATLNIPYLVVATFESAAAAGKLVRIYTAEWGSRLTECTYGTATDGSGTIRADAANSIVWGNNRAFTTAFQGSIYFGSYHPVALTPAIFEQNPLSIPNFNSRIIYFFGKNGTGSVIDESGFGNHSSNANSLGTIPTNQSIPYVNIRRRVA